LTETVDSTTSPEESVSQEEATSPDDETTSEPDVEEAGKAAEPGEARPVTELVEELGRELSVLALRETELETARHAAEVRRGAMSLAGVVVVVAASIAAFAFVNVAAFSGLATALSPWLSALVLAAAWVVIAGVVSLPVLGRIRRWQFWRVFGARPTEALEELEQARDEAGEAVRQTLTRLGPAITVEIASAALPLAGGVGGVVKAGDALIDASDEIVEAIIEEIPAGSVVNQIWDVALMPGRFGLRVATTVLRRDSAPG
jgi:hypothetical protein